MSQLGSAAILVETELLVWIDPKLHEKPMTCPGKLEGLPFRWVHNQPRPIHNGQVPRSGCGFAEHDLHDCPWGVDRRILKVGVLEFCTRGGSQSYPLQP
eukprot:5852566-Amphidinium_carterae.2